MLRRLRGDAVGTTDGPAKEVYVRESRCIEALFTIAEQHIGRAMRGQEGQDGQDGHGGHGGEDAGAFQDSVDIDCFLFQIPLGALIPRDAVDLLAANKNIGTPHITNGAYRLHPAEWSIGEAVGALSAFCAENGVVAPHAVHGDPARLADFQRMLTGTLGASLAWPRQLRAPGWSCGAPADRPEPPGPARGAGPAGRPRVSRR